MISIPTRYPALLLLSILLVACGGKEEARREHVPAPAGPAGVTIELSAPGAGAPETIAFNGTATTITYADNGQAVLTGEARPNGARRYSLGADVVADVTQNSEESFKLKSAGGGLLWKVKLADDKIKVSDNEENEHPYVLRAEDGYVKVKDDEAEIGRVRAAADGVSATVTDAGGATVRTAKGKGGSAAYGVSLMSRIPYPQRMIIMAELVARGR
jgi:hypothetical protein